MRSLAVGLLLLITPLALGDVKIVGETKVGVNKLVRLAAEGDTRDGALIWDISDEDKVDVEECGGRLLFTAPSGSYKVKLRVIRFKDGKTTAETARVTVTIGADPGPGPAPTPGPADPLTVALQAAVTADPGIEKAAQVKDLAELYRQAATTADDTSLKTTGALHSVLTAARKKLMPDTALVALRRRIQQEITAEVGADQNASLDAATRAKAKDAFTRIANALEGLK